MLPEKYTRHRPEVERLRTKGVSYRKIGLKLGFSATTAWRLADPEHEAQFQESNRRSCERRAVAL